MHEAYMRIQGVTESVANLIRLEIITGKLPADAKLNENDLAERFGVSRPPLREAFRKLENENLIVSIPRKGSCVAGISREDCEQIYRARIMIESAAIDILGEQKITNLAPLREAIEEGRRFFTPDSPAGQDLLDYFTVMSGFHNSLVELCRNRWIIHYHSQLRPTLARYQILFLKIPEFGEGLVDKHEEVLRLVEEQKHAAAKKELRRHIMGTLEVLLQRISGLRESA